MKRGGLGRGLDVLLPQNDNLLETVVRDIAIDEMGDPVVIEYNIRPEQNQMTCGPTFGEMTDEILSEVFAK